MKIEVPFYSQNWDLDDWQQLGYKDREDAAYWERSSCGILCAKMVMDSFLLNKEKSISPSIKEIIDMGVSMGAYADAAGWSHAGLANLIKKFGFNASAEPISAGKIRANLLSNALMIVSVKWGLRTKKTLKEKLLFWKKYGGHLAVVVGFEEENGELSGLYLHHTSKIKEQNWEYKYVPIRDFLKCFTGRGISVTSDF
jgi:hypothetical protein